VTSSLLWAEQVFGPKWAEHLAIVHDVATRDDVLAEVYLVGGAVRECIVDFYQYHASDYSGKRLLDIDCAFVGDFDTFIVALKKALKPQAVEVSSFMTAVFHLSDNFSIDFARCRRESYLHSGALPVVEQADLRTDAHRRDFSINAIYIPLKMTLKSPPSDLHSVVIDYVDGLNAFNKGEIEILRPNSLSQDPTRIFRAVRYRAMMEHLRGVGTFGLLFYESFNEAVDGSGDISPLDRVSQYRKWNELAKCFECAFPQQSLIGLSRLNLFANWPPQVDDASFVKFQYRLERLFQLDDELLRTKGFLLFVTLWWWSTESHGETIRRARSEVRIPKNLRRAIIKFSPTNNNQSYDNVNNEFNDIIKLAKSLYDT
jgi:tRNA nucleotidyltransferase/poly(A) polymerase